MPAEVLPLLGREDRKVSTVGNDPKTGATNATEQLGRKLDGRKGIAVSGDKQWSCFDLAKLAAVEAHVAGILSKVSGEPPERSNLIVAVDVHRTRAVTDIQIRQ